MAYGFPAHVHMGIPAVKKLTFRRDYPVSASVRPGRHTSDIRAVSDQISRQNALKRRELLAFFRSFKSLLNQKRHQSGAAKKTGQIQFVPFQFDDFIENDLFDIRAGETLAPVLQQYRCIRYFVRQAHSREPAVCHIDLDFPHQLPLRADSEQVANEQYLEQRHWINCWSAVIGTVQVGGSFSDEIEFDVAVN